MKIIKQRYKQIVLKSSNHSLLAAISFSESVSLLNPGYNFFVCKLLYDVYLTHLDHLALDLTITVSIELSALASAITK